MSDPETGSSGTRSPTSGTQWLWTGAFLLLGLALLGLALRPEAPEPVVRLPQLQQVLARGQLRVAIINSPVTYYKLPDRNAGIEFELADEFAEHLGVELKLVVVDTFSDLFNAIEDGQVDLAAANITVTEERRRRVRFGAPYNETVQHLVYKSGNRKPRSAADLIGREIVVVRASSYAETLRKLDSEVATLQWSESSQDIESLFQQVADDELDLTIADSVVLDIQQRFFPTLRRGYALTKAQPIAWAFPPGTDESLIRSANGYLGELKSSGQLEQIEDRYQAHIPYYDRSNSHYFLRHIRSRLPPLQPYFEAAAQQTGLDWRLLAAIGYAESLWQPGAVSPTGVKGVMMLTSATAKMMGIEKREDPAQSIQGGARYLNRVRKKIPQRIKDPDRMWLALSAYNIGYAHLEDARILTQRANRDPDSWDDVAEFLPLLNQPEHYRTTRYGYSRGRESARYVRNIQSYYDILVWVLSRDLEDSTMTSLAP